MKVFSQSGFTQFSLDILVVLRYCDVSLSCRKSNGGGIALLELDSD